MRAVVLRMEIVTVCWEGGIARGGGRSGAEDILGSLSLGFVLLGVEWGGGWGMEVRVFMDWII